MTVIINEITTDIVDSPRPDNGGDKGPCPSKEEQEQSITLFLELTRERMDRLAVD